MHLESTTTYLKTRYFECLAWLPVQSKSSYLYFSSNEETGDANELERWFEHVFLCGHEAIKVVLSVVVCLPVQFVHFTHLKKKKSTQTQQAC